MVTIATLLTISRILVTAPLMLALSYQYHLLSLCLFLWGVVTDFLDGFIARLTASTSRCGQLLDPIADKIFMSGIGYALWQKSIVVAHNPALYRAISYWIISLVGKEIVMIIGAGIFFFQGNVEKLQPRWYGKLLMAMHMVIIGFLVLIEGGFFFHDGIIIKYLAKTFLVLTVMQPVILLLYARQLIMRT